jgi:hypothetical protein
MLKPVITFRQPAMFRPKGLQTLPFPFQVVGTRLDCELLSFLDACISAVVMLGQSLMQIMGASDVNNFIIHT